MTHASRTFSVPMASLIAGALLVAFPNLNLAQTPPDTTKKVTPPPVYHPPPAPPPQVERSAPPPRAPAPAPSYTPPARSSNPPPSSTPPGRTANPGARPSAPPPNLSGGQTPRPGGQSPAPGASSNPSSRPPTTYTPGGNNASGASRNSGTSGAGGATVYTPGRSSQAPTAKSETGVTSSDGSTTYTPRAPGSSSGVKTTDPSATASGQPGGGRGSSTTATPARAISRPVYTAPVASSITSRTAAGASVLNSAGSQNVVRDLNKARSGMTGVNSKPLPAGNITVHANGNLTLHTTTGEQYALRPNGAISSYSARGNTASFRPNGRVAAIHTSGVDIRTGVHGERTVVTRRPDGAILVGTGLHSGYLERTSLVSGRTVVVRSYVVGGRSYNRFLVNDSFGPVILPRYVPAVYFAPAFYGWMYYPWAAPVPYAWGWGADPWFLASSGYFSPYPVYPSGYAWLTDYFLSQTLAAGFAAREAGGAPVPDFAADSPDPNQGYSDLYARQDTPISPDLKAAITEEVQRQLAVENATASGTAPPSASELPAAMKLNRIFVVSGSLDVLTSDQVGCAVSAGDVLRVDTPPTEDSPLATLRVAASRQADCPVGELVTVAVQDLQEWQNNMRAQIDAGMAEMRTAEGHDGLPAAPSDAVAPPPRPSMAGLPDGSNADVAALLAAQQLDAKQAEAAVIPKSLAGNPF